jgi:multidrug efflux pump subunit AcrA (membrane-fusion protein)
MLQRVDVVRRHSSTALTNAQSHEGLFLLPLWRFIGKSRVLVTARNLPKTILASIFLIAAIAAMWLVPYDFTVTSDGRILPEVRQYVFAAQDGIIADLFVDDGDQVTAGQRVARQESLQLRDRQLQLTAQINDNRKRRDAAMARIRNRDALPRDVDLAELTSEVNRLDKEAEGLASQLEILQQEMDYLDILSPIDGKVVTWKVRDLIENRFVRTGTRLMEIADPTKEWELEIDVPEAKMGHVVRYLKELQADDPNATLEVTFMLASYPGADLRGRVIRTDTSAEVVGESGNAVRMVVAFSQDELLMLLPGATEESIAELKRDPTAAAEALAEIKRNLKVGADVKAKIHCGREPIGYVWFHELWEFIQSRILFRF